MSQVVQVFMAIIPTVMFCGGYAMLLTRENAVIAVIMGLVLIGSSSIFSNEVLQQSSAIPKDSILSDMLHILAGMLPLLSVVCLGMLLLGRDARRVNLILAPVLGVINFFVPKLPIFDASTSNGARVILTVVAMIVLSQFVNARQPETPVWRRFVVSCVVLVATAVIEMLFRLVWPDLVLVLTSMFPGAILAAIGAQFSSYPEAGDMSAFFAIGSAAGNPLALFIVTSVVLAAGLRTSFISTDAKQGLNWMRATLLFLLSSSIRLQTVVKENKTAVAGQIIWKFIADMGPALAFLVIYSLAVPFGTTKVRLAVLASGTLMLVLRGILDLSAPGFLYSSSDLNDSALLTYPVVSLIGGAAFGISRIEWMVRFTALAGAAAGGLLLESLLKGQASVTLLCAVVSAIPGNFFLKSWEDRFFLIAGVLGASAAQALFGLCILGFGKALGPTASKTLAQVIVPVTMSIIAVVLVKVRKQRAEDFVEKIKQNVGKKDSKRSSKSSSSGKSSSMKEEAHRRRSSVNSLP